MVDDPRERESASRLSEAQINAQNRKRLADNGFPARHIDTLDAMTGPGLEKAKALLPKIDAGDCLLVLCGDRGPGKTQMATFWAERTPVRSRYFKAHDLMEAIRKAFRDDDKDRHEADKTLKAARKVPFLVLDEFSELAGSDFERRTLTNILDHRYDSLLRTVIITNHHEAEASAAVGRSIWSRAQETGGTVNCNWPSYRTAHA